jgi:hypothetical protein
LEKNKNKQVKRTEETAGKIFRKLSPLLGFAPGCGSAKNDDPQDEGQ